jgi:hypothetical protein
LALRTLLEAPLRQTVVALQRWQIRSPAQALSKTVLQPRQARGRRLNAPGMANSAAPVRRW